MGEDQGDNNAGGVVERVTITEAATLLGCHRNTIKNRSQAGMYRAEKVLTENGPTWMIHRNSLTNNAPTSARQQAVSGVPPVQQEAIQELARAIVREAGIAQDPEAQARLEGYKMAMEAAKALVLVGSGLLVGMAAVVGVIPRALVLAPSPLLYVAFACVILSIFGGIGWIRGIAEITIRSEGNPLSGFLSVTAVFLFAFGLTSFTFYVLTSSGFGTLAGSSIGQFGFLFAFAVVCGLFMLGYRAIGYRGRWKRNQSSEAE